MSIKGYVELVEELCEYRELYRGFGVVAGMENDADFETNRLLGHAMRHAYEHTHDDIHAALYLLVLSIYLTNQTRLTDGSRNRSEVGSNN